MTAPAKSLVPEEDGAPHRKLSGAEQVAALLISIDGSRAARLLKRLEPVEIRQIAKAAAFLKEVQDDAFSALIDEFIASFSSYAFLLGGADKAETLLAEALPPNQVSELLSEILPVKGVPLWDAIAGVPAAQVAEYLEKQHVDVGAYVLSRLESKFASQVATSMSRELRNETLVRMISPASISDAAAAVIEDAVRQDFLGATSSSTTASNCAKVASIINNLDAEQFKDVVNDMSAAHPRETRTIRKLLFSFNDLPRLPRRALTIILDRAPSELVVLALRGTSADFRDAILATMGARSRRLIESELNSPGPARSNDIAKARKDIAALVLSLAQRNEIEIATSEEASSQNAGPDVS